MKISSSSKTTEGVQQLARENEEKIGKALATLQEALESNLTPKNIKKVLKDVINNLLNQDQSIGVRAANAISILEELSQDPKMPSFSRAAIWSAVSTLRAIREY